MKNFYLSTVALEKNRWTDGKIPTINASDFTEIAIQDGFDGIELWENHFLLAPESEQEKIVAGKRIKIFNTYASFENPSDSIKQTADAIRRLKPEGVKFNFGSSENIPAQLREVTRFADSLPENVALLCECHAQTFMEDPYEAAKAFKALDERFGAIIHPTCIPLEKTKRIFDCYGEKIWHIHAAYFDRGIYLPLEKNADILLPNLEFMINSGFDGSLSIEFTKDDDTPEKTYKNAVTDLNWLKRTVKVYFGEKNT